mmetsp:Transcript_103811/g.292826  ORF Transcript_103811/g.292826 Transcript_103811/m.292826 type:complete len:294 (+) Transcript_103811:378-1259(+)
MVVAVTQSLYLVRADRHAQVVVLHEVSGDVRAEQVNPARHAAGRAVAILALWVGPEQVHHQGIHAGIWLHKTVRTLDFLEADLELAAVEANLVVDTLPPHTRVWPGDASMHHEDLVVDHVAQRSGPEDFGVEGGHPFLILHLELAEETIKMIRHFGFVVPTVHEHLVRLPDLEGRQHEHHLNAPWAAVHEIAVEEKRVVRRRQARQAQHVVEIVELTVQVPYDGDPLALRYPNTAQGLPLHQNVEQIDGHPVRVFHREQLPSLEVRQHVLDERLVDRRGPGVAGAAVTGGLGH